MASDDFTGSADGTLLASHNSDWGSLGFVGSTDFYDVADYLIRGDQCRNESNPSGGAGARYAASTEDDSKITFSGFAGAVQQGTNREDLCVHIRATSTRFGYRAALMGNNGGVTNEFWRIRLRSDDGATNTIRANYNFPSNIDMTSGTHSLRIYMDGTVVRVEWDDSEVISWDSNGESNIPDASGNPGFHQGVSTDERRVDSWTDGVGGGGGGSTMPVIMHHRRMMGMS